jgi:hypothetical protein
MGTPIEREPEAVLDWCRNLVRVMADGAVWGIPRSGVVFKIDKNKKCLILTVGEEDDPDFLATRRVFGQIGWDVVTAAEYKEMRDGPDNPKTHQQPPENN